MYKKAIIFVIFTIIILAIGLGVWKWNEIKKQQLINNQNNQQENQENKNTDENKKSSGAEIDTTDWKTYKDEKYRFEIKYPKEWVVRSHKDKGYEFEDGGINISWRDNRITLFPAGKSKSSCYSKGTAGDFEQLNIDKYSEEFFMKVSNDGRLYGCSIDIDNYPKSWNEKAFIEMEYNSNVSDTVRNIIQSVSFLEDTIDQISLKLYGSRAGVQKEGNVMNTSDWLTEKNNTVDFSFRYPQNAKFIYEGNCYRVEYGLGFVIFFLPIEGNMRCGARTGVGVLPDNVDVIDYLTIGGEKYEAPGFNAVIDTKDEKFFKPETRYLYDFNHMFDLNKKDNCGDAGECKRVGYGIYKEVKTLLDKNNIDDTMNTIRAIVETVDYNIP